MKRLVLILLLSLAAAFGAWRMGWIQPPSQQTAQREDQRRIMRDMAVPITTAIVGREDVPVTLDAIGSVQPVNTVTARSQVDGRLIEVAFREGQDVKAGDVLARVEPAIYQAQHDQAAAKKAQDEAQLANARRDLERYAKLAADNSGSRQQADTQKAVVAQLEAQVRQDQATLDNARTVLGYTTIVSPLDGRTGLRLIDQGNLVRASDQTGIVTITQMKPIAVVFIVAQQFLRTVNDARARGDVAAHALHSDNATVIEKGRLEVIDNQVDPTTGSVKMKAVFPNPGLTLWPGQFVNVRLFLDVIQQATVVPAVAVQRGPAGAFVYVAQDDDTVAQTRVEVGQQNEKTAVIVSGVEPGAKVATTGFARLTNGAKIRTAAPEARSGDGAKGGPAAPGPTNPPPTGPQ